MTYALISPGAGPAVFAAALCAFIVLVLYAISVSPSPSAFMDAATARKVALTLSVVLTSFICALTLPPYFTRVTVHADRIAVTAWWERSSIPRTQLRLERARVVDADEDPALGLAARTGGSAEPGFRSGFFHLNNGARALVFVSDPHRVVAIPVHDGPGEDEWFLASVQQPDSLLAELRRPAAATKP